MIERTPAAQATCESQCELPAHSGAAPTRRWSGKCAQWQSWDLSSVESNLLTLSQDMCENQEQEVIQINRVVVKQDQTGSRCREHVANVLRSWGVVKAPECTRFCTASCTSPKCGLTKQGKGGFRRLLDSPADSLLPHPRALCVLSLTSLFGNGCA